MCRYIQPISSAKSIKWLGAALATILLFSGCAHNNAINFATNTQFGVKVGVNPQQIPEVNIGYARQEAARVPVYLEQQKSEDGFSESQPTIGSILAQAKKFLEKATTQDDATARSLVNSAVELVNGNNGENKSHLLDMIKNRVAISPLDATKRGELIGLIDAEIAKPKAFATFYESGKYIGKWENGNAEDSYSVFGTFSGTGSGTLKEEGKGDATIAQFFATGVAAQLLAKNGGAAAVNPNAEAPVEGLTKEREQEIIQESKEQYQVAFSNSEAIAKYVFGNDADGTSPVSQDDQVTNLKLLRDSNPKPNDFMINTVYSKQSSEASLATILEQQLDYEVLEAMKNKIP